MWCIYIFGRNSHTHTHTHTHRHRQQTSKQTIKPTNQPTNKQQNHRTVHTTGHINIKRLDLTQRRCRHSHQSPFPSTTWPIKSIYLRGWWNFMATTCNSPRFQKGRLKMPRKPGSSKTKRWILCFWCLQGRTEAMGPWCELFMVKIVGRPPLAISREPYET